MHEVNKYDTVNRHDRSIQLNIAGDNTILTIRIYYFQLRKHDGKYTISLFVIDFVWNVIINLAEGGTLRRPLRSLPI